MPTASTLERLVDTAGASSLSQCSSNSIWSAAGRFRQRWTLGTPAESRVGRVVQTCCTGVLANLLLAVSEIPLVLCVGLICQDLWSPPPPPSDGQREEKVRQGIGE